MISLGKGIEVEVVKKKNLQKISAKGTLAKSKAASLLVKNMFPNLFIKPVFKMITPDILLFL